MKFDEKIGKEPGDKNDKNSDHDEFRFYVDESLTVNNILAK